MVCFVVVVDDVPTNRPASFGNTPLTVAKISDIWFV